MSNQRPRLVQRFVRMALLAASLIPGAPPASAGPQTPASATESKPAIRVAITAQDHLDKAVQYRKKAAAYHEEADMHRKMVLDLKKRLPPDTRPGNYESPEIKKMRSHCDGYIKDAEALAAAAEKFAEYHEMRAAELKGM